MKTYSKSLHLLILRARRETSEVALVFHVLLQDTRQHLTLADKLLGQLRSLLLEIHSLSLHDDEVLESVIADPRSIFSALAFFDHGKTRIAQTLLVSEPSLFALCAYLVS